MPKKILLDLKTLASKPLSHASAMPKEIYTSDKILDLENCKKEIHKAYIHLRSHLQYMKDFL